MMSMRAWTILSALVTISGCSSAQDTVSDCLGRPVPVTDLDGSVVLTWNAPRTRIDGSPIGDLSGYKILYGNAPDELRCEIQIGDPDAVTWQVTDLSRGTWYFAVVSVDGARVESKPSDIVSKKIE